MPISAGILILLVAFAIYLGFRIESLYDIWPELVDYEAKIEADFLDFLGEEYIIPFINTFMPDIDVDEVADNVPLDADTLFAIKNELDRLKREGVPEKERNEIISQLLLEQMDLMDATDHAIDSLFFDNPERQRTDQIAKILSFIPSKAEAESIPDRIVSFDESDESVETDLDDDSLDEAQTEMFTYFIYQEGILDPGEFFLRTRSFYRKYRWPKRLISIIQASILILILSILTLLLYYLIGSPIPDYLPLSIALVGIIWMLSELGLWYILSTEVSMETRTNVGKFLKPDPRGFL